MAGDRCPTGIDGLDKIIGGGFPRDRSMLLSGSCGTGKTVLGVQFLCNGAVKYNEPGILVTLEQDSDELRSDMLHFGFDLQKLEDSNKLIIIDTSLARMGMKEFISDLPLVPKKSFSLLPGEFDIDRITGLAIQAAKKIKAKRLVVDSLPALDVLVKENIDVRKTILHMAYEFKANGLTSLLITESLEEDGLTKHGVEEYVTDGVVILKTNEALDTRTIKIRKMRLTEHSLRPHTFEFTKNGINIRAPELAKKVI